ncbi:transglutaminase superfamily protein [Kribbella amoyensis]|uniref:Transglutaminase superfamily protein n=1 Tax=Kribbella amoyensis TaxID=996641 RepID=A0A561BNT1_9ACTN|nr:transglutaminase superfamily protein [Kribbella amoyensis]
MDDLPPRDLAELRLRAEQYVRAEEDQLLLALVGELRGDGQWWTHLWAPSAALAARRIGDARAVALLVEAIDGGFSQPELFDGELEKVFGADAEWPDWQHRMAANIPAPTLELLDWPDAAPIELTLYAIDPARVDALRNRLPEVVPGSAWQTVVRLLEWVHDRWDHANDHVEDPDALTVLDRVDAGARFACVEYSIVLSQALNAVGIPARRLDLRQPNHHVGVGRGHVVSEAWIDELDRWVLLDGQNGAYWIDAGGTPLGIRELQALAEPPAFVPAGSVEPLTDQQAASWFTYFASYSTTGAVPAVPPFAAVFQGMRVIRTPRLTGASVHPDLAAISTGLGGTVERPTVRFAHRHPYGTGIRVSGSPYNDEWALDLTPGTHELTVAVVTPYGTTAPRRFAYRVRD